MDIITGIDELRSRLEGKRTLAFVPTMGNLHEGHLQLMRLARTQGSCVVASIFVNRLQFAPHEDFDRYPRTFHEDCEKLRSCAVDVLFAPGERELYPDPQGYTVEPPEIGAQLEGEFRPGFFRGVATIVLKLFNIVQPQLALFGKKDYQQLLILRNMVRQLNLPIQIVAAETARAENGLVLSSRNGYLSPAELAEAVRLHQVLLEIGSEISQKRQDLHNLELVGTEKLARNQWKVDYVAVRKQSDLKLAFAQDRELVVLGAAWLGGTRLIDNIEVSR